MKTCYICKDTKPIVEFNKHIRSKDGYGSYCKPCAIEVNRKQRDKLEKEYYVWVSMKQRCNNPNNKRYENYGGRNIRVCSRWEKSYKFFIEDMGNRPSINHSIDRIDNDGNYTKDNCRWATHSQQMQNRRIQKSNISGYNGVNWSNTHSKWVARISSNNKRHSLGYFDNKEDAIEARKRGETKYWSKPTP